MSKRKIAALCAAAAAAVTVAVLVISNDGAAAAVVTPSAATQVSSQGGSPTLGQVGLGARADVDVEKTGSTTTYRARVHGKVAGHGEITGVPKVTRVQSDLTRLGAPNVTPKIPGTAATAVVESTTEVAVNGPATCAAAAAIKARLAGSVRLGDHRLSTGLTVSSAGTTTKLCPS